MITANVTGSTLTVRGHAGYAPPGQDIVCAAVSTVVALCEASLEAFGCAWSGTDDGQTVTVIVHESAGQVILQAAGRVLRDLAAQYPAHVAVRSGADGGAQTSPDLLP